MDSYYSGCETGTDQDTFYMTDRKVISEIISHLINMLNEQLFETQIKKWRNKKELENIGQASVRDEWVIFIDASKIFFVIFLRNFFSVGKMLPKSVKLMPFTESLKMQSTFLLDSFKNKSTTLIVLVSSISVPLDSWLDMNWLMDLMMLESSLIQKEMIKNGGKKVRKLYMV